ncbi:hypothetical protein T439DRAFT_329344 [Meredithblackwellia eburnea MCA 4105]
MLAPVLLPSFLFSVFLGLNPSSTSLVSAQTTSDPTVWTPQTYFGDDIPTNCVSVCGPFISDINACNALPNGDADDSCACSSKIRGEIQSCGNCIVAYQTNTTSQSYQMVELIQIDYPLECNASITFPSIDPGSLSSLSSEFFSPSVGPGPTISSTPTHTSTPLPSSRSASTSVSRYSSTSTGTPLVLPSTSLASRSASASVGSASSSARATSGGVRVGLNVGLGGWWMFLAMSVVGLAL